MTDLIIAVVGNPNCGKTTLFNQLTGARQQVGNWPGVTVERKTGAYTYHGKHVTLVDLPGIYSLDASQTALDEDIAQQYLLSGEADLLINILDAAHLERNLYLTTQLLEMGVPMLLVLNMMDQVEKSGMSIDINGLSARLGVPVVPIVAARGEGIKQLQETIFQMPAPFLLPPTLSYPDPIETALLELQGVLRNQFSTAQEYHGRWLALKLLEGTTRGPWDETSRQIATIWRRKIETTFGEEVDIFLAEVRYRFITTLIEANVQSLVPFSHRLSERIDQIVLNRILGIPIFLAIMYLLFFFTIHLGGAWIDFFDLLSAALFVEGLQHLLSIWEVPEGVTILLAQGLGGGVQVVATFIPVIAFLYLFLSFLEDSGYMARAAFVMDRLMRFIGLPGKSFVPLLVGFGCNVPAVMATRTLENQRDRYLTTLITPFMSCGARLPVYALFAVAFFPNNGQNVVFGLYLMGFAMAILTGLIMKNTLLRGESGYFVMELPPYHLPQLRSILLHTWERLKGFVLRAGQVIVPMVLVISLLNTWGTDGTWGHDNTDKSMLSQIGRTLTPVFEPMGITQDNWPATVGIFTGVLAKEVVVGTLDSIYGQLADQNLVKENEPFEFSTALSEAFATLLANLSTLGEGFLDPLGLGGAETEVQAIHSGTYKAMMARFDGQSGALAYLLFILLYFPCTAVVATLYRETGGRWALFVTVWSTGMAYGVATLFYQWVTFSQHPVQSFAWIIGIIVFLTLTLLGLHTLGEKRIQDHRQVMHSAGPIYENS